MPRIDNLKRPWIIPSEKSRNKEHNKFYDSTGWRRLRLEVLQEKPLCEACKARGIVKEANIGDHIQPVELFPELALSKPNIMPLCESDHAKKSSIERGVRTKEQWLLTFKDKETVIKLINKAI
jgi:5-methylcytosine-specific restriction endonuclease McrA